MNLYEVEFSIFKKAREMEDQDIWNGNANKNF